MLHCGVVFLVIALVAALFGFGGIAVGAVGIAKLLFVVFMGLAVFSFVFGLIRRGQATVAPDPATALDPAATRR